MSQEVGNESFVNMLLLTTNSLQNFPIDNMKETHIKGRL